MNKKVTEDLKIVVKNGHDFKLKQFRTSYNAGYLNDKLIKASLESYKEEIAKLQDKLFAQGKHTILLVLQAIDASGKDSCIKHVLSGINPQGCHVTAFKQPTQEELNHDFLWRTYKALPAKGMIGVFNRSYYEEVLVAKVHPEFILNQKMPHINAIGDIDSKFWKNRYRAINEMERHLVKNGTIIIKLFLNMSKDEQKIRFLERTNDPTKNWKFNLGDLKERKLWDAYQTVYEEMIQSTSTKHAPWHIIPADNQWVSRVVVGDILLETLQNLNLAYPVLNKAELAIIEQGKAELKAETLKKSK
ncbi:MAG: polyphosphate kinase 2 family protein [bacterium]|nr:polyphosphate kinase 2 family protein [bacterium]